MHVDTLYCNMYKHYIHICMYYNFESLLVVPVAGGTMQDPTSVKNPRGPCTQIVYTLAIKGSFKGSLRPLRVPLRVHVRKEHMYTLALKYLYRD